MVRAKTRERFIPFHLIAALLALAHQDHRVQVPSGPYTDADTKMDDAAMPVTLAGYIDDQEQRDEDEQPVASGEHNRVCC